MSNKNGTESVKLPITTVNKVRANKKKTKVPITSFIVRAIDNELKKQKP